MNDPLGLGVTIDFPFRSDGHGGLVMAEGIAAVESHLRAIMVTQIGEHAFDPQFGWAIEAFMPIQDSDVIAALVKDAIEDWEDRVDPRTLQVEVAINDEGELLIQVLYQLRSDASPRTLAFGFRLRNS